MGYKRCQGRGPIPTGGHKGFWGGPASTPNSPALELDREEEAWAGRELVLLLASGTHQSPGFSGPL